MKCNCLLRVVTRTEVARSGSGDKKKSVIVSDQQSANRICRCSFKAEWNFLGPQPKFFGFRYVRIETGRLVVVPHRESGSWPTYLVDHLNITRCWRGCGYDCRLSLYRRKLCCGNVPSVDGREVLATSILHMTRCHRLLVVAEKSDANAYCWIASSRSAT